MHGNEGGHIGRGVAALRLLDIGFELIELGLDLCHRKVEALYFGGDEFSRNLIMIDLQRRAGNQMRMTDGDAARDAETVQGKAHMTAFATLRAGLTPGNESGEMIDFKVQNWRGVQGKNGSNAAPVLEFALKTTTNFKMFGFITLR